ncbi:hypothetical protein B0F90DRAFT_1673384 [Multifurca ochricompacta]|uniref:Uncharacterized protein n=1 Tax=Multifurca ochricompacta TaxID=376703 RepID=A0AAD4MC57_9AGAM|nr:hypothetical protein B0F90DRAFT_1673384 [Multifurca ochricompacta]
MLCCLSRKHTAYKCRLLYDCVQSKTRGSGTFFFLRTKAFFIVAVCPIQHTATTTYKGVWYIRSFDSLLGMYQLLSSFPSLNCIVIPLVAISWTVRRNGSAMFQGRQIWKGLMTSISPPHVPSLPDADRYRGHRLGENTPRIECLQMYPMVLSSSSLVLSMKNSS